MGDILINKGAGTSGRIVFNCPKKLVGKMKCNFLP